MTDTITSQEPALSKYNENQKSAHEGLERLKDWKNSLGHSPFYCSSMEDGNDKLRQAQGMVEVISALFAAGRDGPDEGAANLVDATYAAALDGVSTLINLARLETDGYEHRQADQGAAK